jgi:hypothetical protein
MDTGEIPDGAFRLYRLHFRDLLAAGLLHLSPEALHVRGPAPAGA